MQNDMSFLIDSNVVIAAEPYNGHLEEAQPAVSSLLRLASQNGHHVFVHPATREDLEQTREPSQRAQNLAAYEKYPALTEIPVPAAVWDVFPSDPGPNDQRDARILAALHAEAVHFLVTNDGRLRKRAARLGFEHRVLRPGEAAAQLAAWHPGAPPRRQWWNASRRTKLILRKQFSTASVRTSIRRSTPGSRKLKRMPLAGERG